MSGADSQAAPLAGRALQVIDSSMARDVGRKPIKQDRIKNLREKLLATVAELDRMLVEVKP